MRVFDHYELLEVSGNATPEEIRHSFRKLAFIWHPDKNNNSKESEQYFILLRNAYEILSDENSRREYDRRLSLSGTQIHKTTAVQKHKQNITQNTRRSDFIFIEKFNILLWNIEDIFRKQSDGNPETEYTEKQFRNDILDVLIFIDKWILTAAGLPDYFMASRKLENYDPRIYKIQIIQGDKSRHIPFVSAEDYFYNIRKRMNGLLTNRIYQDISGIEPETGLMLIDLWIQAERYSNDLLYLIDSGIAAGSTVSDYSMKFDYLHEYLKEWAGLNPDKKTEHDMNRNLREPD